MASSSPRGLRLLKAIENYSIAKPNQWDTGSVFNKIKLVSASEGRLRATFKVEANMCNSLDTLHGGYVSTIIDVLSLFGQMSHEKGKIAWTTNMNIVYLNAAFKGEQISVETVPIIVGKVSAMEVILMNERTHDVIARGTTSFLQGSEKYQQSAKDVLGFDVHQS